MWWSTHLFDQLDATQLAALRTVSEVLVAHLSDTPVWPAARDGGD